MAEQVFLFRGDEKGRYHKLLMNEMKEFKQCLVVGKMSKIFRKIELRYYALELLK